MKINKIKLPKKKDKRGWLVENIDSGVRNSMQHFLISTSKPSAIRGQHYHKRKTEWLVVLRGKAKIYLEDLNTKEKTEFEVKGEKPELVEMMPMLAHAIENIGNNDLYLLGIVSEPLDPNDQDTFPYKVKQSS